MRELLNQHHTQQELLTQLPEHRVQPEPVAPVVYREVCQEVLPQLEVPVEQEAPVEHHTPEDLPPTTLQRELF